MTNRQKLLLEISTVIDGIAANYLKGFVTDSDADIGNAFRELAYRFRQAADQPSTNAVRIRNGD